MGKVTLADLLELPVAERILLVQDIWDSIAATPEAIELTDDQRAILDQRLEAYHRHPDAASPWDEVKKRIQEKR